MGRRPPRRTRLGRICLEGLVRKSGRLSQEGQARKDCSRRSPTPSSDPRPCPGQEESGASMDSMSWNVNGMNAVLFQGRSL